MAWEFADNSDVIHGDWLMYIDKVIVDDRGISTKQIEISEFIYQLWKAFSMKNMVVAIVGNDGYDGENIQVCKALRIFNSYHFKWLGAVLASSFVDPTDVGP